MKLWRGQPDNWKPEPLSRGRHIAFGLGLAAIFLFLALDSLGSFDYEGPCRGRAVTCMAAKAWASVFQVPMGTAMAHIWLLLALTFGLIALLAAPPRR